MPLLIGRRSIYVLLRTILLSFEEENLCPFLLRFSRIDVDIFLFIIHTYLISIFNEVL